MKHYSGLPGCHKNVDWILDFYLSFLATVGAFNIVWLIAPVFNIFFVKRSTQGNRNF